MGRLRLAPVEFRVCGSPGCSRNPRFRASDAKYWSKADLAALLDRIGAAPTAGEKTLWRRIHDLDPAAWTALVRRGRARSARHEEVKREAFTLLNQCLNHPAFFDPEYFNPSGPVRALRKLRAGDTELHREISSAIAALQAHRTGCGNGGPAPNSQHSLACLNRFLVDCFCDHLLPQVPRTAFARGSTCPVCQALFSETRGRRTTKDKLLAVGVDPAAFVREGRCHCPRCGTYYQLVYQHLEKRLTCPLCSEADRVSPILSPATISPGLKGVLLAAGAGDAEEVREAAARLDREYRNLGRCPHCDQELLIGKWCPLCHSDDSLPAAISYVWVDTGYCREEPLTSEADGHDGLVVDPLDAHAYAAWLEQVDVATNEAGD